MGVLQLTFSVSIFSHHHHHFLIITQSADKGGGGGVRSKRVQIESVSQRVGNRQTEKVLFLFFEFKKCPTDREKEKIRSECVCALTLACVE